MMHNSRRLRRPEERVGSVTNADLPPPNLDHDAALVQRMRERDDATFEYVFHLHLPAMLRVARTCVRTAEEAEEVVQETWMAVLSGIHRFQGRSSFKTWLFRILINRARSRGRREARELPPDLYATPPTPEQHVLDGEMRGLLERAVASLPRLQRLVITLRDIEGWDAGEVCSTLKITAANQRVLLHRARMRVRDVIGPYLSGEDAPWATSGSAVF